MFVNKSEMLPVTRSEFADVHPFAPPEQQQGFARIAADLCLDPPQAGPDAFPQGWMRRRRGLGATPDR